LDQVFSWLCQILDRQRSDSVAEFILERCEEEIKEREIYIPLCRTFSSKDFTLGEVEFKSISKELLDGWFPREPLADAEKERRIREFENRTRAKFQSTLAACIRIRAERTAAEDRALEMALNASALLRFLSKANWTSKIRSFVLPLGMENSGGWHSFHLTGGVITEHSSSSIREGPHEWVVDEPRQLLPGLLESLSDLAKSQETEFRKNLLDSMLIYSRNSATIDPADKLVFVLVALESMLLKDPSEPIQGNLGERMALLIGISLDEKKRIVAVVKEVYGMRSKFIHHGQGLEDLQLLDEFLNFAWLSLAKMLELRNTFKSRMDLLNKLDEMKLS
jgi:hypothetical protein